MDSGAVIADCCPDVGFERRPEGQMPADAEAHRSQLTVLDTGMPGEVIESRSPVFIEMRNGSPGGIFEPPSSPAIIERDGSAERLEAVINFGCGGNETVAGQPGACAQH